MSKENETKAFKRLLVIMDELRAQCPWDKAQTFESLRALTIEETYELADAVLENNLTDIKKELGDLLLHIVFYAKIGSETQDFNISDVINGICEKLIFRHPHIYSDVKVTDAEEVEKNWEKLKLKEGKKSVLQGVPKGLSALVKAFRIQEKVSGVGFDWDNTAQVFDKVKEELSELQTEINTANKDKIEAEFGDVLFSLVNYARFLDINPENALERTNKKFIKRFNYIEKVAKKNQKPLNKMTLDELNVFWESAKKLD
jgi:MazG family protein